MGLNDIGRDDMFKALISIRLTKKEKEIISYRYGLEDGESRSFEEVAKILKIKPDYVRTVERKALAELRNYSNTTRLRNAIIIGKANSQNDGKVKDTRSKRNLYEYFCEYTEEEIDEAINQLPEDEKSLLVHRYGSDLKNPELNELSNKQMQRINNQILPQIQMALDGSLNESDINYDRTFDEKSYVESMQSFKKMKIENVIKSMPHDDSIIMSLAFGLVDEKIFTPHEIADMLSLPEDKVKETILDGLSRYESMTTSKIMEIDEELNKGRSKIKNKVDNKWYNILEVRYECFRSKKNK